MHGLSTAVGCAVLIFLISAATEMLSNFPARFSNRAFLRRAAFLSLQGAVKVAGSHVASAMKSLSLTVIGR